MIKEVSITVHKTIMERIVERHVHLDIMQYNFLFGKIKMIPYKLPHSNFSYILPTYPPQNSITFTALFINATKQNKIKQQQQKKTKRTAPKKAVP